MLRNNKIIATFVCMLFILTLLFSIVFIIVESNHDCKGIDCPICLEIKACIKTINTLGIIITISTSVIFVMLYSKKRFLLYNFHAITHTLVSLKVKLSN